MVDTVALISVAIPSWNPLDITVMLCHHNSAADVLVSFLIYVSWTSQSLWVIFST